MDWLIYLVVWLGMAAAVGAIGAAVSRLGFWTMFGLSLLLSPIAGVIVLLANLRKTA